MICVAPFGTFVVATSAREVMKDWFIRPIEALRFVVSNPFPKHSFLPLQYRDSGPTVS